MYVCATLCHCATVPKCFSFFLPSLPPRLPPSPLPTSHPSQLPQHVSEGGTFGPDTVTDAVQNCWRTVSFPPSLPPLPSPSPSPPQPSFLTHTHLTPSPPHKVNNQPTDLLNEDEFLGWVLREPVWVVWLPTLHRLAAAETGTLSSCLILCCVLVEELEDIMTIFSPSSPSLAHPVKHEAKCSVCKVFPLVGFR